MLRKCKKCKVNKVIENFYKNKNVPSGYVFQCKDCVRQYGSVYYNKNKKSISLKISEYKKKNRERFNELSRIWAKNNPEKRKIARKKWKDKNRELVNHYEKARQNRLAGASGSHTLNQWLELVEQYKRMCAYCNCVKKLTKDHVIPVSKGGTDNIENIVPACVSCNSRKGIRLLKSDQ